MAYHNNQAVSDHLQLSVSNYRDLCVCVCVCVCVHACLFFPTPMFVMSFPPLSGQIFMHLNFQDPACLSIF